MQRLTLAAAALISLLLALAGCGSAKDATPGTGGPSTLSISSNPSGARVFVDGVDTGRTTPTSVVVSSDDDLGTEHVVTLMLTGYNHWSGLATVSADDTFRVQAALVSAAALPGSLRAQSVPAGARIFVDGADTGQTTPATLSGVAASQHVVEYRLDGHHPFREEVVVAAQSLALSAPALTRVGSGRVAGRVVDPEGNGLVGAQVMVNGLGVSTETTAFGIFTLPDVPAGTHTLSAAITTGGTALLGTRDQVAVEDGRLTANADIITAAEGSFGSLVGRVTDSRGALLEGAEVFASQAVAPDFVPDSTLAPRQASSDANGSYSFTGLPAGFWVVTAAYPDLATVTQGINPQVFVAAGAVVRVDFQLPSTHAGTPAAPLQLQATAFTMPETASRAPAGYEGIRGRLLAARRTGRWGAPASRLENTTRRPVSRTAPPGSLIETDLSWVAPGSADIIGYFIGRSGEQNSSFSIIEDLLNPHAGLWIDYDPRLSPGRTYFYRMTAVNSRGLHSSPSNTAQAQPLDQITVIAPSGSGSSFPIFSWNELPGGFTYGVQLFDRFPERATQPLWESDQIFSPQTSVQYDGPALQSGHTYYWVVVAGNSASLGSANGWSISRITSFNVP